MTAFGVIPFGTATITAVKRVVSGRDRGGDDVFTETETTVSGCSIQPATTQERIAAGDLVQTRVRLFAPPSVDFAAIDAIDYDGTRYEIDGDPELWPGPFGGVHHVEVWLRKATG